MLPNKTAHGTKLSSFKKQQILGSIYFTDFLAIYPNSSFYNVLILEVGRISFLSRHRFLNMLFYRQTKKLVIFQSPFYAMTNEGDKGAYYFSIPFLCFEWQMKG